MSAPYVITCKGHRALTLNILLEKLYINLVLTKEAEWSNSCQSFDANWHVNMKASAAELNVPLSYALAVSIIIYMHLLNNTDSCGEKNDIWT